MLLVIKFHVQERDSTASLVLNEDIGTSSLGKNKKYKQF